MIKKIKWILIISSIAIASSIYLSCKQLGLEKEKSNNTTIAAAALISSRSSTTTSSSCNSSTSTGTTVAASTATLNTATDCATGITTCMDSALPAWIKENFKCAIGYVSGSNYVFKSQNIPNTKSYYFTAYNGQTPVTTYPLYESLPAGNTKAGSNVVISQNLVYTIPVTPTKGTGTDSTQGGLVSIGITTNGLAIFNATLSSRTGL